MVVHDDGLGKLQYAFLQAGARFMHFLRLGLQAQQEIQSIGRDIKLAQSGDLDIRRALEDPSVAPECSFKGGPWSVRGNMIFSSLQETGDHKPSTMAVSSTLQINESRLKLDYQ